MNLINETKFAGGYAPAREKSGKDCVVIVAKARYSFPKEGYGTAKLLNAQEEPYKADVSFDGVDKTTLIAFEHDYVPFKPYCDVLLVGTAYAPQEAAVEKVTVGLEIGTIKKSFSVVGDRKWERQSGIIQPTKPVPFRSMPLHYGVAYGGMSEDMQSENAYAYAENMLGKGYYGSGSDSYVNRPLPNTEEIDRPVEDYKKQFSPRSFGVVAKNSSSRLKFAGTYDENWQQTKAPFLPDDFDERFYQAAPEDQQCPYLEGGELVVLRGLTPESSNRFELPTENLLMTAVYQNGDQNEFTPRIDTLTIEPDKHEFSIVWRYLLPLRKSIKELDTMIIGTPSPAWKRAQLTGKLYVPLSELDDYKHML